MRDKGWGASGREAGDTLPARARGQAAGTLFSVLLCLRAVPARPATRERQQAPCNV